MIVELDTAEKTSVVGRKICTCVFMDNNPERMYKAPKEYCQIRCCNEMNGSYGYYYNDGAQIIFRCNRLFYYDLSNEMGKINKIINNVREN